LRIALLGGLVGATLYAESVPGGYFDVGMAAEWAWILLVVGWVVAVARRCVRARSVAVFGRGDLVVPALVALVAGLIHFDMPLHARYRLSRSAMVAAAQRVLAHPKQASSIHRIGLWPASRVEKIP